jgi:hypothetical protein
LLDVEPASTGSARVFGPSSPDSFASFDPATSSWRTSQLSLLGDSIESSVTWPRAGMTRNGIAYPLVPLAPLTRGIASGSWPTPKASDSNGGGGQWGEGGPDLRTAVKLWPTPEASDGTGGRVSAELGGTRPSGSKRAVTLATAVAHWPTPTARLGGQRGAQAKRYLDPKRSNDLDDAVAAAGDRGSLNPTFVEWLMNFPLGWTEVE